MQTSKSIIFFLAAALITQAARAGELPKMRVPANDEAGAKNPVSYYTELAQIHLRYQVYDKAEECFKKAIELAQGNNATAADLAGQLGRLYLECNRSQDAVLMFEYAVELTPDEPSLLNRMRELIRAYNSVGDLAKAEAACLKAMERAEGPMKITMEKEYFLVCQKMGKLDKIIAEREKLAANDPKNEQLFSSLAYLYRLAGNKEKELDSFRRMVDANPADYQGLALLAAAYRGAGQFEKAVDCFEKLIKLNPNARPYYVSEIVKLYAQAGKKKEAEEYANKLIDEKEMATAAGRARVARLYMELGVLDKAIEHFTAAITLPSDPQQREQYQLELARACSLAKKFKEAEEVCSKLAKESRNASIQQEAKAMLIRIRKEQQPPAK